VSSQDSAPVTLVVGSDSLVGRAYFEYLQATRRLVLGTTRRQETLDESHVYLDLAKDVSQWICPPNVSVAVICAGITSLADCKDDPTGTRQVNVEGKFALVNQLLRRGAHIIYLSTSAVFDGSIAFSPVDAPQNPITEYGRQHTESERRLQAVGNSFSIIRFTKIIGPELPLLSGWVRSLKGGKLVTPYSDMVMAPVPVSFAVEVIDKAAESSINGIFHASGNYDVTYAAAASFFAETLGADPDLVQPINSARGGWDKEPVPSHTTLDNSQISSDFGIAQPDVWETLQEVCLNLEAAYGESAKQERD
jgi:dTDP-4-dehydrorhamnose reductase